jgi:transcriptional repressor NrdR
MFCINCFYPTTSVTNSRANKKQPIVWRRRHCSQCSTTFTTKERPALSENKKVHRAGGATEEFNLGKLVLSIAKAFAHSPHDAEYSTLWLAQTVENTLSTERENITADDLEVTVHQVLKNFDELAAVQYAAQHHLISAVRKRGRPSLA